MYGLIAVALGMFLSSCESKSDPRNEVEYLPFQESKDGSWGLISPDGKILFSEEFKNEPTVAVNGRFMVRNSDGLWEIYTAEKNPQKIGGEYMQAGMFYEEVAPVVEEGKPIQFINRDGEVKVTLDKIDGKPVTECSQFSNGLAAVKIDDLWGAVDTDGDLIISPEYISLKIDPNGKIIGLHKKYKDKEWNDYEFSILNDKGKTISTIKGSKVTGLRVVQTSYRTSEHFIDDGILVAVNKDDKDVEGLMGIDGEWKIKPSGKILQFKELRKDKLTYMNEDGFGLASTDGEILLRPKFTELGFLDENTLAGKKDKKDGFTLYNLDGEKISKDDYENIFTFHSGMEYTFAMVGKGDYILLNRKGEEKKLDDDVYYISGFGSIPDFKFESDYVDIDAIVSGLKLTKEGFLGLTTNMTAPDAIEAFGNLDNKRDWPNSSANNYTTGYNEYASGSVMFGKAKADVDINILTLIETRKVSNGWWTNTEYSWSQSPVPCYRVHVSSMDTEQLQGKMRDLYVKLAEAVKALGKEVRKGKNATVINPGNDNHYWVYWTGDQVWLYYGKIDPSQCFISEFDNVTEEEPTNALKPTISVSSRTDNSTDNDLVGNIDETSTE